MNNDLESLDIEMYQSLINGRTLIDHPAVKITFSIIYSIVGFAGILSNILMIVSYIK